MKINQYGLPLKLLTTQNHKKTTRPKQKSVPLIFEQMTSQPPAQTFVRWAAAHFCAVAAVLFISTRTSITSAG